MSILFLILSGCSQTLSSFVFNDKYTSQLVNMQNYELS